MKMSDQGDSIQDETSPVVVHFSISKDKVCNTPPGGDCNGVYYWRAPDFMDGSLFVDLLTEIVDAISDRDSQRFLELIEPSQTSWAELRRWNRRRKKWFSVSDDDVSLRVREACSTFSTPGDFISLFPPEGDFGILSADVLINNDSDPSGEIRKCINQNIASDIAADIALCGEEFESAEETEESQDVCVDDTYPSDEEEEIDEVQEANPEKPCYYPSQIEMATILKKRIDTIMWHYHNIAKLSDAFDDVEFAVYTARYRMLSDQTEKRICHPDAGVLSKQDLKSRKECNGKKRMFMYVRSAETDMHFEQLRKDVQEKPRTLFIIIADECHWGITKDKDQKPSAHNLFINEWCKENSPRNVVVVQISATPFNLLTQNSRLPEVRCLILYESISTARNNHYEAGDLLVLESEPEIEKHDFAKPTSKEVELHVVHWSEVELKNFERGMRMKLKSTLTVERSPHPRYLHVSTEGKLGVVYNKSDATDFLVQGSQGIVTIKAILNEGKVRTLTGDSHGMLQTIVNPQESAMFEVKLDFGVGVAAFSCSDRRDLYLAVDDKDNVLLQTARIERKCGVSIMKAKHDLGRVSFEFYIDHCGPAEVDSVEQQYLSLNYYLSTMNCGKRSDQKIRQDKFFQGIVDTAKRQNKRCTPDSSSLKIDALLCAEYCYYILLVGTYNSDDKIRQALINGTGESPADQFSEKVRSFREELKNNAKYIHHEAFELVVREICGEVNETFTESVKKFSRSQKQNRSTGTVDSNQNLETEFVACLMHLSREDLKRIMEDPLMNGILNEIKTSLKQNNYHKMIEIWKGVVRQYETGFLVESLIQSGKGESGKMKIVRAKSMETADQFYHTLKLARKLSSLEKSFEIIRDYGGIQIEKQMMKSSSPFFLKLQPRECQFKFDCRCSELELRPGRKKCTNCQHVHKSITLYEDLENLACVLILVDKGRMGDTFPQSFDCLDLRLNYDSSREFKEGSPLFLSTVIQELGRMCRYAKASTRESRDQYTPYVLVGRELFKRLGESLKRSPAMSTISCTRADRYMSTSKSKRETSSSLRWLEYEAHKDSYDYGNKQTHCNRILLQAEPQIGKTGTYLCLIKQLRQDILGKEKMPLTQTTAFDEGSFYLHEQCDSLDETIERSVESDDDWQFPYWKTIENSPSLYEKAVGQGKYSIGGLFYTHDIEDSPFFLMKREKKKPIKSILNYQRLLSRNCADGVRAWHWYHFENCVECGRLLQGERPVLETFEVTIDGAPVKVTCSIPTSGLAYNYLRGHLRSFRSVEGSWTEFNCRGVTSLSYWIFHPSHRDDPRKCLLNYRHVMQEENQVASYLQVAVVRSEKFQAYNSTWGKVMAIFQLPDELPNCELGPNEGGVGYSRLFIQKIAFALGLEYVFVIDDNVALMSEAVFRSDEGTTTGQSVVRDENGVMKTERCSFLKPLTHLQKIASGKGNPPDERIQYEPHPLKDQPEGQQFPLYTYTGPAKLFGDRPFKSYGILGLLRSVPISVRPFAKTQVYAAVLLNVKSTVEKEVFYRPWPCWEDLRFNDDCDKADLWVVKCNRFLFHKVQYNDWIKDLARPTIYVWKKDSFLEKRPLASELPKIVEEEIILDHLRSFVNTKGHENCFKGQIGYDLPDDCEDQLSPTKIIDSLDLQNYEWKELGSTDEVPVLIVSYCASVANRKTRDMMLLISAFCAAQEKIIFITSAEDALERWPGLTLATVASHNGICLTSEMSDRCGRFSILSAADPRRHHLRWIVIEASFSKEDGMILEELNVAVERNVSENATKADESILADHQQHFSGERTKASEEGSLSTKSKEIVDVGTSHQPLLRRDSGTKESLSANRSPHEISCLKRPFHETLEPFGQECSSVRKSLEEVTSQKSSFLPSHTFRHDSPNAKQKNVQESPSKRRKIVDYFGQKINQTRDEQSVKKTFEEGGTAGESSNSRKVERKRLSVDDRGESNSNWNEHSEAISETEQSKVKLKKKKKQLKTESNQKSRNPIHTGHESMLRSEEDKHMAFRSSQHDIRDVYVVNENGEETSSGKKVKKKKSGSKSSEERNRKGSKNDEATSGNQQPQVRKKKKKEFKSESSQKIRSPTHACQGQEIMSKNKEDKQKASTSSLHEETDEDGETTSNASSQTSTYSIQGEDTEWPSVPDTYSADDVTSNSDFNTSSLRRTSTSRNQNAEKMSLYMAGTNDVTAVIVNLWNQRKQMEKREDLSKGHVEKSLDCFVKGNLETIDQHGYNALLKACSLPSMSPHVMQHLIVVEKVDLNCRLPDDFDEHHPSAKGLIPGMSALSVAIRRQNISCISTFKRREPEIKVRDADQEGNTALHHCVASASKGAFQKLFPLYKQLDWKEMFNSERKSPLHIAQKLAMDSAGKKKQALGYILEEMEGRSRSYVFSVISSDEEDK